MTVFVEMYNPALDNIIVDVPTQAADDYAARGWLLVDPDAMPVVVHPYLTQAAGDSRYVRDAELDAQAAALVADSASALAGAQRAAFGALQKVAATVTASGALAVAKHNPVDASSGAKTMTLPTGQPEGTQVSVEKTDSSTNVVSVTGSIRGVGSSTITLPWQNEALLLRADSSGSWWPVSGHKTKTSLDAAYAPKGDLRAFNIFMPENYGAVGDGTTDDTTAVKAAVDAARLVSGTVLLHRMFLVNDTIVQDDAFAIVGPGPVGRSAGLKAGPSMPANAPLLWSKKTNTSTAVIEGHMYGAKVDGIRLDGNARTVACKGWQIDVITGGDFRNVQIRHFAQEGMLLGDSVRESDWYHVHVRGCGDAALGYAAVAINHSTTKDGHNNLHFYGLYSIFSYGIGLQIKPTDNTSPTRNIQFHSLMVHGMVSTATTNDDLTITPDWRHVATPAIEIADARAVTLNAARVHRSGNGQPLILIRNNSGVATTENHVTLVAPSLGTSQDVTGTVTADAATDVLTSTGIKLGTGAVVRFTTTTTLPAGLSLLTDYYAIRVTDDTFKVATTRALAEAGTAIDITSAGTGTHTVTTQSMSVLVESSSVSTTRVVSPVLTDTTPSRAVVVNKAGNGRVSVSGVTPQSGVTVYEPFSTSDSSTPNAGVETAFTRRQPSAQLLGFYAALANRHNAPADILVLGDSIGEGQGSTSLANRWIDLFRDRLRERFPTAGVAGGPGFVPGRYAMTTPANQGFTETGNTSGGGAYGLGARGCILGATTGSGVGSLTITRTCTSFDIHYRTSGTGVAFTVTIDGGAPTTVTGLSGEQVWSSPALTDAAHTIVITQSNGSPNIEGAMFYRGDEAKGIRVWDGSRAGSRLENFITGGTFALNWADSIPKVTPDLILIGLITNDVALRTPAQFKDDLTAYVALIRAQAPTAAIAITLTYERASGGISPWVQYVNQARTVAAATSACAVLDVGDRIPRISPDTYSLLADSIHPNNKGHALLADAHMALLAPYGN